MMLLQLLPIWCVYIWTVESAVLDPSLYLSPRPPLTDAADSIPPTTLWSRSAEVKLVPVSSGSSLKLVDEGPPKSNRKPNAMEKAKLFWPSSLRTSHYSVGTRNIQIPLTFGLSGIYGKYGAAGTGIIGSSYGTVSEIGGTGISTLAGNGYGNYRTYPGLRVYGRENGPVWSGWGNGKWGHYGKG